MPIGIGIVVRYKDDLLTGDRTTVGEHNKILRAKGKVWLGKFGIPVRSSTMMLFSEPNVEARLILVRARKRQNDTDPRIFVTTISSAQNKRPTLTLVPGYYREHCYVDTWFCLTSELRQMKTSEAKSWVVASSKQPLLTAISTCPRTFFVVCRRADLARVQALLAKIASTYTAPAQTRNLNKLRLCETDPIPDHDLDFAETFLDQPF